MLYEYYCGKCDIRFEEQRKLSEDSSKAYCPKCKSSVGKVPSLCSFHLVGDCWAKDGYSSPGQNPKGK